MVGIGSIGVKKTTMAMQRMVPEKIQKKNQGEFAAFEIPRPTLDLGFALELIISESLSSRNRCLHSALDLGQTDPHGR